MNNREASYTLTLSIWMRRLFTYAQICPAVSGLHPEQKSARSSGGPIGTRKRKSPSLASSGPHNTSL
jgi:hypothetical protein